MDNNYNNQEPNKNTSGFVHSNWSGGFDVPERRGTSPGGSVNSASRKGSSPLLLLLTCFVTFAITASFVWGLAAKGILPGTGIFPGSTNQGVSAGDFGLSIQTDDPETKEAAEKLAEVVKKLQDNYYKVLSPAELMEAMAEGVANSMDSKYTYYMTRESFTQFNASIRGDYSGIGASVSRSDEGVYVITAVQEAGPAAAAGILPGDLLMAVDGKAYGSFANVSELAAAVKGEEGSYVTITIRRNGEEKDYKLKRSKLVLEQVHTRMLANNIGYMQIAEFSQTLPTQFKSGLETLLKEGAEHIVFDMRGNPGGSAAALQECLDMLLDKSVIATTRGREDGEAVRETWSAEGGKLVPDSMRYAILVNGNTASAAELFSGCLRDYDKAVLIGSTTYGKGSGTRTIQLRDGSAINVTVFNYYLPKGDLIEGKGLVPTIEANEVSSAYNQIPRYKLTAEQDPGLAAAQDYFAGLKGKALKTA